MTKDTFKDKGAAKLAAEQDISISLAQVTDAGVTTYYVLIVRGDRHVEADHTTIKGRAEYDVALWRYVLLGEPEPDILSFDTSPPEPEQPITHPTCHYCGSDDVNIDAVATYNKEDDEWQLLSTYDGGYCNACEQEQKFFTWVPTT